MKLVASTPFYAYHVDPGRNNVIISLKGSWMKLEDVPNCLTDLQAALTQVRPGFGCVADLTELKASMLTHLWTDAQKLIVGAGVGKVAEVHAPGSIAAKAQVNETTGQSGLQARQFFNRNEAESWLGG